MNHAPAKNSTPYWQRRGLVAICLWPLGLLFGCISACRRWWLAHVKKPWQAPVPVIVVGNLTVGGAGKTSTVIALVQHLKLQGWQPGVISRGYGRDDASCCLEVCAQDTPQSVGDEPLLIKRRTAVPVFVAAKRVEAAQALLKQYPQTSILVCDDGLQHYALARHIEVAVFDDRGAGNGWLLPAGPLREPLSRLKAIDLVLYNAQQQPLQTPGYLAQRQLTGYLPLYEWFRHQVSPSSYTMPWQPLAVLAQQQKKHAEKIVAIAGIGNPQRFFQMLAHSGIQLTMQQALPDHYSFEDSSFEALDADIILITEKDAAKCLQWQHDKRLCVVGLSCMPEPAFFAHLDQLLSQALA